MVGDMVAELGLEGRVELQPGYVPATELDELFADADLMVLPYRSGTASQNAALAFAHGVPVVFTDAGTLAQGVTAGVDGLVVKAGDVPDLAAALRRLYAPDGLLETLRAGVRTPDQDSGWPAYLQTLVVDNRREGDRMTTLAPPGGRALEIVKRVAERVVWTRVGLQLGAERYLRTTARPVPASVPPTAVLRSRDEWQAAVAEARRLRLPLHHDRLKNWDALGAVAAVVQHVGRSARVLDAGSARYSSVLPWLRLYGLTALVGINLEFGAEEHRGPSTPSRA